jgi:hypothetical protein
MQKIVFLTGLITLIASVRYSAAQSAHGIEITLTPFGEISSVNADVQRKFIRSHQNLVEIKITSVHIKAARNFARSHNNISDAKWFKSNGGYIANLQSGGINKRIVYDEKGRWFYNVLSYAEDKLDVTIRDMVKSKYYDHDIIDVHQYQFQSKTVYLVKMIDQQSNFVTVKVHDGRMEVISSR